MFGTCEAVLERANVMYSSPLDQRVRAALNEAFEKGGISKDDFPTETANGGDDAGKQPGQAGLRLYTADRTAAPMKLLYVIAAIVLGQIAGWAFTARSAAETVAEQRPCLRIDRKVCC